MNFIHTRVEIKGKIGILTMDSPPVNALGEELKKELSQRFEELGAQEEVWTVILTAAGDKFFAAGANIPSLLNLDPESGLKRVQETQRLYSSLANFEKPTIAAINGTCFGGGLELALCCDLRIAADHIKLGFPEVNLGIMPGAGGTQRLPRLINPSLARYLIYTGSILSAAEALSYGLVIKSVPYKFLMEEAVDIASKINEKAPLAVRAAKKAVSQGCDLPLEKGLNLENKIWANLCNTQDKKEGILAFLEKRKPQFKGK